MRIEKLDHVVIYVKNLEAAMRRFSEVLGTRFIGPIDKRQTKPGGRGLPLILAFDMFGTEYVTPTQPSTGGWIPQEWYDQKGEGLIHLTYKVDNLEEGIKEFEAKGVKMINRGSGVSDLQAALFSAESTHGVMIELVQYDEVPHVALGDQDKRILADTPWFKG